MLGLFLSMGVMLFGTFVHMTDGHSASGDFDSIPSGMWFALVTLTTVGYGEAVRVTRVFASFQKSVSLSFSVWCGCVLIRNPSVAHRSSFCSLSACCPACECTDTGIDRGETGGVRGNMCWRADDVWACSGHGLKLR